MVEIDSKSKNMLTSNSYNKKFTVLLYVT